MSFEIHREPLYRRYYASAWSGACCYTIVYVFGLILLPLIIAYNSSDFWLKEDIYFEQPRVEYTYNAIFEGVSKSISTGALKKLYYSSNPALNDLFSTNLRVPVLSSAEKDNNRDGICDSLEVSVVFPLSPDEQIVSIGALFLYHVQLDSKAKYLFESSSYLHYDSSYPISAVQIEGDLQLKQKWSLITKGGFRSLISKTGLLPISQYISAEDVSVSSILRRSHGQNLSLEFAPSYAYATADSPASTINSIRIFNASFVQHIPIQTIRYTPPVSEVLKYAWIQYISFFAVVSFLLFRLNSFVFRHQLVYTKPVVDVKVEKTD